MEKSVALHTLLKLGTPSLGGLLIHGPSGCGKSALVSNLCAVLEKNQGLCKIPRIYWNSIADFMVTL